MEKVELGVEAEDKITGFRGIVVGFANYLFGCKQYGLAPKITKDGKRESTQWFDEGRIKVLGRGVLPKEVKTKKNGAEYNFDSP